MSETTPHGKKSAQPIKYFYKIDGLIFQFLLDILKPLEIKVLLEIVYAMDCENCFEISPFTLMVDGEKVTISTPREYIQTRFELQKDNVNKILKRLALLGILSKIDDKKAAYRVNPWIANRAKYLSGYWEFDDIKLLPILDAGYNAWLSKRGLLCMSTASMRRLKVGEVQPKTAASASSAEISRLNKQIMDLIDQHAEDCENFLKERKEYQMFIHRMESEFQQLREQITDMDALLRSLVERLEIVAPEESTRIKRHLKIVKASQKERAEEK